MTTIRDQARSWAEANWDPEMTVAQWWECLFEARYCLPSLPVEAFGRGYSRQEENESRHGLREAGTLGPAVGISTMMAAPTIAAHGTPEQIERYIPPMLTGQESWCQLFSEPGAGSDLAGLQTTAVRDGDTWTINGQKVWTSLASGTEYGMLLARSDRDKPKHAGITWFAFPMRQAGVDIRPLVEMTGQAFFNEVFLDDAVVNQDAVIGAVNDGWRVANTTLIHERASLAGAGVMLPFAGAGRDSPDLDKPAGSFSYYRFETRNADPDESKRLPTAVWYHRISAELGLDTAERLDARMRLYISEEVNRMLGLRARAGTVPAVGNLGKLAMSEIARLRREVGNQSIGAAGMLAGADADAGPGKGDVQRKTLHSPAPAIYGGTDQVQRNIIGERFLGLPKEPAPPPDTPFKDLPAN